MKEVIADLEDQELMKKVEKEGINSDDEDIQDDDKLS